jgi:hypothetical protein
MTFDSARDSHTSALAQARYLSGEMTLAEAEEVESHLWLCVNCLREMERVAKVVLSFDESCYTA